MSPSRTRAKFSTMGTDCSCSSFNSSAIQRAADSSQTPSTALTSRQMSPSGKGRSRPHGAVGSDSNGGQAGDAGAALQFLEQPGWLDAAPGDQGVEHVETAHSPRHGSPPVAPDSRGTTATPD